MTVKGNTSECGRGMSVNVCTTTVTGSRVDIACLVCHSKSGDMYSIVNNEMDGQRHGLLLILVLDLRLFLTLQVHC